MYYSQENLLTLFYDEGSDEWWAAVRAKIAQFAETMVVDIRNLALKTEDPRESIRVMKKAVALCELVYDEGDYCFLYTHLSDLYIFIAHRYVRIDDTDTALDCFEKGFLYPDLVDVAQLQEMLAVIRHTAYDLIGSGAFTCAKVGRKYLIPKIEIIKFLYKDSISAGGGARA